MKKLICILMIMGILLAGCVEDKRRFTVIDDSGKEYNHLIIENDGWGFTSFTTEKGKLIVFYDNYTIIEE